LQRRNDLAWDGESKRIIAVGDGKEKLVVSNVSMASFLPPAYHTQIWSNIHDGHGLFYWGDYRSFKGYFQLAAQ